MSDSVSGQLGVDPTLPDVTLILGGRERKLCFDFNALVRAEKETGVNLLQAIVAERTATNLRGLLWASMLKANPNLQIDAVGSWITPQNIGVVWEAILAAWFGSSAEKKDDETPGEAPAQEETPA